MTPTRASIRPLRTSPFGRTVVAAWRRLARDENTKTLIACSGGADSVALLLALASAEPDRIAVGHVRHDMREEHEARADEDHARALADALGIPFLARVVTGAKTESAARPLRYDALTDLARGHVCACVATGHHADDQLETFLMRAIRGSGPSGLRGIAEERALDGRVRLVRPMLGVTHDEAIAFCRETDVEWREDPTNRDTDRTRAALRARVLPALREIRPDAALRVSDSARLQQGVHDLIERRVLELNPSLGSWARTVLLVEHEIVVSELLRSAYKARTPAGHDRLGISLITPTVRAVMDDQTDTRVFDWPGGIRVRVTTHEVAVFTDDTEA